MAQVASYYVEAMLKQADRLGLDRDELLSRIGLKKALLVSDPVLDSQYSDQLIRHLWQETDDEFLGLAEQKAKRGLFYTALKLALHADSLYGGLREICKFHDLATDAVETEVVVEDDRAIFTIKLNRGDKDPDNFLIDFLLCIWHRAACWLIGVQIPLIAVNFPYPQASAFHGHRHIFPTDLRYGQPQAALIFHPKYLDYQMVRTRSELRNFIRHSPRDLMEVPGVDRSIESRIKAMILEQSDRVLVFPPFETVAETLCVSPQTLRRKLRGEGSSYQTIKHALRRDLCTEKLVRTNLSIAEIAYLVGFSEPAALTHTFRKWTGMSPAEYRKKFV